MVTLSSRSYTTNAQLDSREAPAALFRPVLSSFHQKLSCLPQPSRHSPPALAGTDFGQLQHRCWQTDMWIFHNDSDQRSSQKRDLHWNSSGFGGLTGLPYRVATATVMKDHVSDRWVLTARWNLFIRRSCNDTKGKEPLIPKICLGVSHRCRADALRGIPTPGLPHTSDWDNHLALIQLKEPVTFSETVFPIPLPERGEELEESVGEHPLVDANMLCTGAGQYEVRVCFWDAGGARPWQRSALSE
ncbi:hypothetical protein ACEWY4_015367 [Coilia grayii]|uniref:Uncharacterized protein n=1 Tax=Coilia grayii TaxID=363190 RepID=A0ABD1JMU0_9TELE